jgi:hypothetical protein
MKKIIRTMAALGCLLLALAGGLQASHDPNTFNDDTLINPPGCSLCVTTFAFGFPTANNFSAFGITVLPNKQVLVSNTAIGQNELYLFPNDTADAGGPGCPAGPAGFYAPTYALIPNFASINPTQRGVIDMVQGFGGRIFATAASDLGPYTGRLVELTWSGGTFTTGPMLAGGSAGGVGVAGAALDPISGRILYVVDSAVHIYDPVTDTNANLPLAFLNTHSGLDGLAVKVDPALGVDQLYVADLEGALVRRFNINRSAGVPVSATELSTLCAGFAVPDGIAVGQNGTCLQNKLLVNSNEGKLNIVDDLGLASPNCSTMVSGGSRGDFVKVGPRGWLYATQSTSIALIRPSDGTSVFVDPLPTSCNNLVLRAQQLASTGCISSLVAGELGLACQGSCTQAAPHLLAALGALCGGAPSAHDAEKHALAISIAQSLESRGCACASAALAQQCPGLNAPAMPGNCVVTPEPTAVPAPPTATPLPSSTPTMSFTETPVLSATPTFSATPTATASPTARDSFTASPTPSQTPLPSFTPTASPSPAPCCPTALQLLSVTAEHAGNPGPGERCVKLLVSVSGAPGCLVALEAHPGNSQGNAIPLSPVLLASSTQTFTFHVCMQGGNASVSALVNGARCLTSNRLMMP